MTAIKIVAVSRAEASFLLRRNLGPLRGWDDFLADCAREKTTFEGLELLPVAYVAGRCGRPVYDAREVARFINEISRRVSLSPTPARLESLEITVDSEALKLPHKLRRATISTPRASK